MADEDLDDLQAQLEGEDDEDLDDLPAQLQEFDTPEADAPAAGLSVPPTDERRQALYDVSIDVVAILGTAELQVSQILKLGRGAVVELERLIGEPVELRANNRLVAHGEVVVIEDRLAVKLTDIAHSENQQN